MELIFYFIALTLGLVMGLLVGRFLLTQMMGKLEAQARERAAHIVREAEAAADNAKERKHLEAKARFQELKQQHEAEVHERKRELAHVEQRIQEQQKAAHAQSADIHRERERIHREREQVDALQQALLRKQAEVGERTCIDLNIHGLHPELVRLVGRMKYRSSYGQNLLQHSREVANLCAIMAAELGLNPKLARRAGLLHDIGKVSEDNPELPHALLGMELAQKHKEHPEIVNAIGAHHDEIEMTSLISPIVQACDAISGARPGARREMVEAYIQRLKDLETLALGYPGVSKSFALQAGRELRIIVEAERVSDDQADALAQDISARIQSEMQYPGQIKITVIREKRAVAFAK